MLLFFSPNYAHGNKILENYGSNKDFSLFFPPTIEALGAFFHHKMSLEVVWVEKYVLANLRSCWYAF
jgi:hypothetical protein